MYPFSWAAPSSAEVAAGRGTKTTFGLRPSALVSASAWVVAGAAVAASDPAAGEDGIVGCEREGEVELPATPLPGRGIAAGPSDGDRSEEDLDPAANELLTRRAKTRKSNAVPSEVLGMANNQAVHRA